jgi:hypothetical protein
MKTAVRLAALAAFAASSVGCLGIDILVKVKGDGSGTIEESLTMNPTALAEMAQTMKSAGADSAKVKDASKMTDKELMSGPFDPEELKKQAAQMGEGVTFVSATPIREKDRMGTKAVFSFKDLNLLKVNQKPMAAAGPGGKSSEEDKLKFSLTKQGKNSVLKVISKAPAPKAAAAKPKETPPPGMEGMEKMGEQMFEMMKPMLKGLRITIGVEVDGTVVKTNSAYVSGNRVTYMDMDFGALLADEKALKAFGEDMDGSLDQQKAALAKVKGMKIHLEPEMFVEFAPK